MRAIYKAALALVARYVNAYAVNLYGPNAERDQETRKLMRERRDYWHVLGSRIRQRMERQERRT